MRRTLLALTPVLACTTSPGSATTATSSETPTTSGVSTTTQTTTTGNTATSTTNGPGTSSSGDTTASNPSADSSEDGGIIFDVGSPSDLGEPEALPLPQLWYSVEDRLVYIELDPTNGTVAELVVSTITSTPPLLSDAPGVVEFNSLTMLGDGSLVGARAVAGQTQLYYVAAPPTTAVTDLEVQVLGDMPDQLYIEAMYTDCNDRVYLMDTGVDNTSSAGNRLIRFTNDYLAGNFAYEVITDLSVAAAADIDDMAPGIDNTGAITDSPGFAMDSGTVYDFDYTTGTGSVVGTGGTYGIHALGGPLFDDGIARLYVMGINAELYEADPVTLDLSQMLAMGPALPNGGFSGLAGPLTDCRSSFPEG